MATIYFQRTSYETAKNDLKDRSYAVPQSPRNLALRWNLCQASEKIRKSDNSLKKTCQAFHASAWIGRGFMGYAYPSLVIKDLEKDEQPLLRSKTESLIGKIVEKPFKTKVSSMLEDSGLFDFSETTDDEVEEEEENIYEMWAPLLTKKEIEVL